MGIINDSDITNKNYKILYKASLQDRTNYEYIVELYEEELNEKKIEDYLNNRADKRSILKSILVDYNEINIDNISENSAKKNYSKYFFIKIGKKYFFIFEDNPIDPFSYDYNVIRMKKENSNKDSYMKDITSKLNDYQQFFTLTTYLTDQNSIFFFLVMPIDMNNPEDSLSNQFG